MPGAFVVGWLELDPRAILASWNVTNEYCIKINLNIIENAVNTE